MKLPKLCNLGVSKTISTKGLINCLTILTLKVPKIDLVLIWIGTRCVQATDRTWAGGITGAVACVSR